MYVSGKGDVSKGDAFLWQLLLFVAYENVKRIIANGNNNKMVEIKARVGKLK